MKIFPAGILLLLIAFVQATAKDPCSEQCMLDGAVICMAGSSLSAEGICVNYYFRTPSRTEHCYSVIPTASCPHFSPLSGNAAVRRMQVIRYYL